MATDHGNGSLNTALLGVLTTMSQALGRVEAGQVHNRQTVLDVAQGLHIRMEDLRGEVFRRMDRIEMAKTARGWRMPPWWVIMRIGGFILSGLLLLAGHMTVAEFKALLGLGPPH